MLRSISVGWRGRCGSKRGSATGAAIRQSCSVLSAQRAQILHRHTFSSSAYTHTTEASRSPEPSQSGPISSHKQVVDHVCDVCIVGGGTVGTALACALASTSAAADLRISLIEAGDLLRPANLEPNHFSNRVSSLTPGSIEFLKSVGVWDLIPLERKRPYTRMHVWDAVGEGSLTFDASTTSTIGDSIATIVENTVLQHALVQRLQQFAGNGRITIHNRAKVRDITAEDGLHAESFSWPILELEEGKTIQTRLLVGADGGNSRVRQFAGIESLGWDYQQMGLVATLKLDPSSLPNGKNDTAWQRFLPTGPVALLPLNEEYSSLVWSTTPTLAKHLCSLPPATFVEILNAATTSTWPDVQFLIAQTMDPESTVDLKEERMWGLERNAKFGDGEQSGLLPPTVAGVAEGSRAPFPLKLRNAEEYVRSRVALIGDAAHTVHPLAGQGLNLGIADAQALANTIKSGLEVGQDIGHIHLLESTCRPATYPIWP
ncbi:hypothetical protein DFS34DRAFT_586060 [Phlyctochytrium arcticum]|nr:hypothetical protein DFS34DRAFT_586060 [Phlyctochytrium arcticum]